MRYIELTQDKFAIVDDEDYEFINQYKWYVLNHSNTYYVARSIIVNQKQKIILMHRFIMDPKDNQYIDHINRNGLDNRKYNLRLCDQSKNKANSIKPKTCCGKSTSSMYKGVSWRKDTQKWRSYIKVNAKQITLGCFDNEIQAAKMYDTAAKKYFGEFARINIYE